MFQLPIITKFYFQVTVLGLSSDKSQQICHGHFAKVTAENST